MALIFDQVSDAVDKFMAQVAVWVAERTGLRQLEGKALHDASPELASTFPSTFKYSFVIN